MKTRSWWCLWVVLAGWMPAVLEADVRCAVCLRFLEEGETFVTAVDQVELGERPVCKTCTALPTRCFLCAMPVQEVAKGLSDRRQYCDRDAQTVVFDSAEVRRICLEAREVMDQPLARFMTVPGRNVEWTVEDGNQRTQALAAAASACALPHARYNAVRLEGGELRHRFAVLNGLPKARLTSTSAHLYAHAWFMEQVRADRRAQRTTVEGACELVTLKCLEAWGEQAEARRVTQSPLSEGQLAAFLEADRAYELFRILEWMKFGADDCLIAGDPDRVRRLDEKAQQVRRQPVQVVLPPQSTASVRGPEELTLLSIVGKGNRRLVLINDGTLAAGEEGRVHVGTNVVRVRCVEIREESVLVLVGEETEKKELRIRKTAP